MNSNVIKLLNEYIPLISIITVHIFLEPKDIVLAGFSNTKRLSMHLSASTVIPKLRKEAYQITKLPGLVKSTTKKAVFVDITRAAWRRRNDNDIGSVKFKNDFTFCNVVFNYRIFSKFLARFRKIFPGIKLVILPVNLRYWAKSKYTYSNYHPCKVVNDMLEIILIERKLKIMLNKYPDTGQISNIDVIGTDNPEDMVEFYKAVGLADTVHFRNSYYKKVAKIMKLKFNV